MTEDMIRSKIHQAVDAHGTTLQEDPFLAQRILAASDRKEAPRMKKLSTGAIIAIVLMLLSVTAVAVGLTVEQIWQQSFEKMGTSGVIRNLSDETQAEITVDEALSIARAAIIAKYGTPVAELDAMGVYPTYTARGWDGKTDAYPSEWEIYFSSRTDVDLDYDYTDHGPTGEYRVYINAETKEVTYCHWYTNDFWSRAQIIWDCGSYDEVHWQYKQAEFYTQPVEMQRYWEQQLADKGYEVLTDETRDKELLRSNYLDMIYYDADRFLDPTQDAQAAAAWAIVEQAYGYDAAVLQKHWYVAVRSDLISDTDDIFISYNHHGEQYHTSHWTNMMAGDVARVGTFLVRFEPGTEKIVSTCHMEYSYWNIVKNDRAPGIQLYEKIDWNGEDLLAFSEAFALFDRAMQRMHAAGYYDPEMEPVARDFIRRLGGNPEWYPEAPAELNVDQWFAEKSEWDALIGAGISVGEATAMYGADARFWPMEVLVCLEPNSFRMPNEGETTIEQAAQMAIDQIIKAEGQEALDSLGNYTLNVLRYSLTDDPEKVDCRWEVYITDNPAKLVNGWKVTWGEWENRVDVPTIQHITDLGNG